MRDSARKLSPVARGILTQFRLLIRTVVAVAISITDPRRRNAADSLALELIRAAGDILAGAADRSILVRVILAVEISVADEPLVYASSAAPALELVQHLARSTQLDRGDRARLVVLGVRLETVAAHAHTPLRDHQAQIRAVGLSTTVLACHANMQPIRPPML